MNRQAPAKDREEAVAALQRALELTQTLLGVADRGDVAEVLRLDAERLGLLKSARLALQPLTEKDRSMLRTIADLNARSIGQMEHRFRAKCRDMDMLAAGRRAVRAYANTR
jgi:hypothetical protein